jgi:hypothetical protein
MSRSKNKKQKPNKETSHVAKNRDEKMRIFANFIIDVILKDQKQGQMKYNNPKKE